MVNQFLVTTKNSFLTIYSSSECVSTLYASLQHALPHTNTKFKLLLLPTQMGVPYTNIHIQHSLCRVAHAVPQCNTKFKLLLLQSQAGVCHTQTLVSTEQHISSLHSHFWVHLSVGNPILLPDKNRKFLCFFIANSRECSSTLYVGMTHIPIKISS